MITATMSKIVTINISIFNIHTYAHLCFYKAHILTYTFMYTYICFHRNKWLCAVLSLHFPTNLHSQCCQENKGKREKKCVFKICTHIKYSSLNSSILKLHRRVCSTDPTLTHLALIFFFLLAI